MTPRMLRTTSALPTETLELERFAGLDGQGLPSYETEVEFEANVVEYDFRGARTGGREFAVDVDGSEVRTPLNLWIQGTASVVPDEQDRVTRGESPFIVVEKKTVQGLRRLASEPDHYHLRCRKE
jgi:hypothetical protein